MSRGFPNSVDVIVVGGGPAGLATAIAVRRQGLSVLVADGAVAPIDKACGEGLMPDGLAALQKLGVTIPDSEAHPFCGIRFVNGDQKAEAMFPNGTACGIRRTALHKILAEHAASAGAWLLWQSPISGVRPEGALVAGELVRTRWIVGADGANSRTRHWASLNGRRQTHVRFAFRRHYNLAPWTDFVELHWGRCCQFYVTPVGPAEICVAMISENSKLRLDEALTEFPELAARLARAEHVSSERGGVSVSHKLRRVYRGHVALVGDASAGVDAITGEGLCLAFEQSILLAESLACGDLEPYQIAHRKLSRRPTFMARLMLLMAHHERLRRRTMQVFESSPRSFAAMLAMHVGAASPRDYLSNGISLGWQLLCAQ